MSVVFLEKYYKVHMENKKKIKNNWDSVKQKNQILNHIIKPQMLELCDIGEWIDTQVKQK